MGLELVEYNINKDSLNFLQRRFKTISKANGDKDPGTCMDPTLNASKNSRGNFLRSYLGI